jgi:hypothetical protein
MNKIIYIEALGNFLSTYRSDLTYIRSFQEFKKGEISEKLFLSSQDGSFQRFINEYRVARNISKAKVGEFLSELKKWIDSDDCNEVDRLAKLMRNADYTLGKIMTVLCSKVLFLNNPYEIIPMDSLAKIALHYKGNSYAEFKIKLADFKLTNKAVIEDYLCSVEEYTEYIEKDFKADIKNIQIIRFNRFIDKLLWTAGKNNYTHI